jgi:DNA-binding protein HU-beta
MAKRRGTMTQSELVRRMAEMSGLTRAQVRQILELQARLAYRQARNTFTIPGIGKLVVRERPARDMVMRFGPAAGQVKRIPKKKVIKFRIAKIAKDRILETPGLPDTIDAAQAAAAPPGYDEEPEDLDRIVGPGDEDDDEADEDEDMGVPPGEDDEPDDDQGAA